MHRQRQAAERDLLGDAWQEHELVFPGTGGKPIEPAKVRRLFHRALVHAGLPDLQPHELRQEGWKQQDIAMALRVTPGTVSQRLKRAREQGVEALRRHPASGRQSRLTPE